MTTWQALTIMENDVYKLKKIMENIEKSCIDGYYKNKFRKRHRDIIQNYIQLDNGLIDSNIAYNIHKLKLWEFKDLIHILPIDELYEII